MGKLGSKRPWQNALWELGVYEQQCGGHGKGPRGSQAAATGVEGTEGRGWGVWELGIGGKCFMGTRVWEKGAQQEG